MKQPNECRPIERIEFCAKYDPQLNVSKCIECDSTHYILDQGGVRSCVARIVSVNKTNCDLQISADVCACKDAYVINPNTQVCLKKPDFCIDATVVNEVIQCTTCDRTKAYLDGTTCKIGTLPYCQ